MKYLTGLAMAAVLLGSCSGDEKQSQNIPVRTVNVTVQTARLRDVQITETAVGRILNPRSVTVSAEVPAKVAWIGVDVGDSVNRGETVVRLDARDFTTAVAAAGAEIARLSAQIGAQERLVERYRKLAENKFISPTALDQAEAELAALRQAKKMARARSDQASLNLTRTRVRSPISGRVQERFVAAGDYVKAGESLVSIVAGGRITISIPFPETKAGAIHPGQDVRLHLPGGRKTAHASIRELSPMIGRSSGSFEARVELKNPGGWRPGGSVIAEVVVERHEQAVVVPEESVVLRPEGEVVYLVADGKALERAVQTGVHVDGRLEIVSGLEAGESIAVDGASFLTDGAAVRIAVSDSGRMP